MTVIGIIFILYMFFLLFVGFYTFRLNNTHEDYLLAGRKLGPWVTAFSERASGESAWLILALPGAAITLGLVESWTILGIILGVVCSWSFIAEKLRSETEKYKALTIPEFLHRRFDDSSNIIRVFSSIIIAFFFIFYVSAQFHASGKVLNSLFLINPLHGITIGALVIIIYTLMGGFFAVAWTDLLQGVLMISTLVILPIAGLIEIFSSDISIQNSLSNAELIFKNNNSSFFSGKTGISALLTVLGGLSWGLGYLGQPHLLIRYMAIKSLKDLKLSKKIAIIWVVPGVSGAFLIGLVSLAYFGPEFFVNIDSEQAMPMLAKKLLPSLVAGLFISGSVAAMMSTADSQLLVSTSAVTEDICHQFLGLKFDQKGLVQLSRIMIIILGVFAYSVAIYSQISGKNIFSVVSYAWSGLGSSFGPVLLLTLWWRKTTREGVIAGLITGFFSTIIWSNISFLNEFITERLASFTLSFLAVSVVSIFSYSKKPNED